MKKLYLLLMTVFAISLCASAQTRTVRGIVLDVDNDEPLPGVSVSAGANGGAVTDIDGVFAIKVPANVGKLTFSMVGFKTVEANIPSAGEMLVKMHLSATNLDEVIADMPKRPDGSVGMYNTRDWSKQTYLLIG